METNVVSLCYWSTFYIMKILFQFFEIKPSNLSKICWQFFQHCICQDSERYSNVICNTENKTAIKRTYFSNSEMLWDCSFTIKLVRSFPKQIPNAIRPHKVKSVCENGPILTYRNLHRFWDLKEACGQEEEDDQRAHFQPQTDSLRRVALHGKRLH